MLRAEPRETQAREERADNLGTEPDESGWELGKTAEKRGRAQERERDTGVVTAEPELLPGCFGVGLRRAHRQDSERDDQGQAAADDN